MNTKYYLLPVLFLYISFFNIKLKAQTIPEDARKNYVMAQTLMSSAKDKNDYDLVIEKYKEAIRLGPATWGDPLKELGMALELAERYDEAIEYFKKYIDLKPGEEEVRKIQDEIYIIQAKKEKLAKLKEEKEKVEDLSGEWYDENGKIRITIYKTGTGYSANLPEANWTPHTTVDGSQKFESKKELLEFKASEKIIFFHSKSTVHYFKGNQYFTFPDETYDFELSEDGILKGIKNTRFDLHRRK